MDFTPAVTISFIGEGTEACDIGGVPPHISMHLTGLTPDQAGKLIAGLQQESGKKGFAGFESRSENGGPAELNARFTSTDMANRFAVAAIREAGVDRASTMMARDAASTQFIGVKSAVTA